MITIILIAIIPLIIILLILPPLASLRLKFRRCDNCGKINPPIHDDNPRLCGACVTENGFYRRPGQTLGANGKINWWSLRFPIQISWRGWWKL